MMVSLFSSFDLNLNNYNFTPFILYAMMPMVMWSSLFWITPNHRELMSNTISSLSNSMVKSTSMILMKNSTVTLSFSLYSILMLNLSGAMPIYPTLTSHLTFTMSMAFPMWMAMLMAALVKAYNMLFSSFVPESSPLALSWFLSLVEVISSLIRPITLSFRLAANISAGHVILAMMTSATAIMLSSYTKVSSLLLVLSLSSGYAGFEFAICCVQAYVFSLLMTMYSNDYIKANL